MHLNPMKTIAFLMIESDPKIIHYVQTKGNAWDIFQDKKRKEILGPIPSAKWCEWVPHAYMGSTAMASTPSEFSFQFPSEILYRR